MSRPPVSAEAEATRRRTIVDAAVRFATAGLGESWTMHEIAAEARCGIGSVYRHFPSKEDLIIAMQDEQVDRLGLELRHRRSVIRAPIVAEERDEIVGGAIVDAVAVGRAWIGIVEENGDDAEVLRRIFTTGRRLSVAAERLVEIVAASLVAAHGSGAIEVEDPFGAASAMLITLTDVVHVLGWTGVDEPHRQRMAAEVLNGVMQAWGADPGLLRAIDDAIGAGTPGLV